MTKITTCDRCGSESDGDYGMSSLHFQNENGHPTFDYDLCPKCINELAHIVKDWVEKENAKRK
jgi:hypothetical protein